MNGSTNPAPCPITPELLADLQAGLLDDATAARLRRRVRSDPAAADMMAALGRVRRDVATLGADAESAPPVPPEVSARLVAALRAGTSAGARWRRPAAVVGACAVLAGIGVGVTMLVGDPGPMRSSRASLGQITVSPPPTGSGLSLPEPQILGLLSTRPDLGPLADPQRRSECLFALGYPPGVSVLGARQLDVDGRRGVLVLLPGDTLDAIVGVVVAPECGAQHTEPITATVVTRPAHRP